jgi:hypothetical protein
MTTSRVVHFEVHASEPEALDYWLIRTGPDDQPGINGGLVRRPVAAPAE